MSKRFEEMLEEAIEDMEQEDPVEDQYEPDPPKDSPADRIKNLIDIREYVAKIVESPTVPKKKAYAAINLLPAIDEKILDYVLSDDFKQLLGVGEVTTTTVRSAFKK